MCSNLQIYSNLPKEITEPQISMDTTGIHKKYDPRMDFCTIPTSMESDSTVYIYIYICCCHELQFIHLQLLG